MKKIIFFILFISSICQGQTQYDKHDKLIAEANSLKQEGNYKQAIEKYEQALEILIPSSSTPFFRSAECALKIENIPLADYWIRKGVSVGGAQISYLKSFEGFSEIQKEEFYKKIIADYNSLRQKYFTTINDIDLYFKIEELTSRDQFVRKTGLYLDGYSEVDYQNAGDDFSKARKAKDSIKATESKKILFNKTDEKYKKTTSELMKRVDSLNVARLMEITEKHGWQERAWIILWHQRGTYGEDNYIWNYFTPLINKEIEEGKLSRNFWGSFEIFKSMMENGTFGTIQVGEKPKNEIKREKDKIKG
ncbi:MAG: tetratricopeptide repeat protein [Bacteroidota bacterium]